MLIPVLLFLLLLLCFGWVAFMRHHKELQIAQARLHQQEIKASSLVFQLREASEKYYALEERFHETCYQLHLARNNEQQGADISDPLL